MMQQPTKHTSKNAADITTLSAKKTMATARGPLAAPQIRMGIDVRKEGEELSCEA
jgi:hypothetical protein